jgi:hypothetical protein
LIFRKRNGLLRNGSLRFVPPILKIRISNWENDSWHYILLSKPPIAKDSAAAAYNFLMSHGRGWLLFYCKSIRPGAAGQTVIAPSLPFNLFPVSKEFKQESPAFDDGQATY